VSSRYVHHSGDQTRDLAGFIQRATWLRSGFPELAIEVQGIFGEEVRAAVRFIIRGTHSASLLGEEPTSGEVALDGIMIYRFEDELIAEDWEGTDEGQLRRQPGL
jgi:predicted ester cyclase